MEEPAPLSWAWISHAFLWGAFICESFLWHRLGPVCAQHCAGIACMGFRNFLKSQRGQVMETNEGHEG